MRNENIINRREEEKVANPFNKYMYSSSNFNNKTTHNRNLNVTENSKNERDNCHQESKILLRIIMNKRRAEK